MLSRLRFSLISALLVCSASNASAQITVANDFDGCGTMIQGVECEMFSADSGGLFLLSTPISVAVGDRLHVVGAIDVTCISFCQQGPCLNASLVEGCAPGVALCAGDGGDQMGCTNCPCGNNASAGSPGGCTNSTGGSAELTASGSPNPLNDTLRFEVTGATHTSLGVLISAARLLPANPANPCLAGSGVRSNMHDGLRCIGQLARRHGGRASDSNGDIGVTTGGWGGASPPGIGLIAQGGFALGQTRHWQVTYREVGTLVCLTGLNTTNAISTTFMVTPVAGNNG